jgi:hypothetical protein
MNEFNHTVVELSNNRDDVYLLDINLKIVLDLV